MTTKSTLDRNRCCGLIRFCGRIRISLTLVDWRQHSEFLAPRANPLSSFHLSDAGRKAGKDQPVFLFLRVILGVELRCLRACPAGNGWHREIEGLLLHQQRL